MKIRIKGNALRYRLTKSDVDNLAINNYLEEQTCFAGQTLIYALQGSSNNRLSATFKDHKITLYMPDTMIQEWISTDRVGFAGNENELSLLIEKDFKCLDDVAEDQSDNYPNPLARHQ